MNREAVIQRAIEEWAVLAFAADARDGEYVSLAHHIDASLWEHERTQEPRRFINGG